MAKLYVIFVLAQVLLLVHVTARNVPSTTTTTMPPIDHASVSHDQKNTQSVPKATAPSGAGLDDQKNFIAFGGVGAIGGVGGYAGVIPLGGIGGLGGGSGLGGAGGVGGLGGAGGLGGVGGGIGGAGGKGGGIGGAGGVGGGVGGGCLP